MKILETMKMINWQYVLKNPYSYVALAVITLSSINMDGVTDWVSLLNQLWLSLNSVKEVISIFGLWFGYLAACGYPTQNKTDLQGKEQ